MATEILDDSGDLWSYAYIENDYDLGESYPLVAGEENMQFMYVNGF